MHIEKLYQKATHQFVPAGVHGGDLTVQRCFEAWLSVTQHTLPQHIHILHIGLEGLHILLHSLRRK